MSEIIRIGSRESKLAVAQANIVKGMIEKYEPGCSVEIITMKTTGDRILNQSLDTIGGKGLFVKELDAALLEGQIDIAVHSLKDMLMETPEELPILAYTKREDPRDVLIYKPGVNALRPDGIVGTSSRRRTLQMQSLYPECSFKGIRGNVQTRLRKLETEDYDGTILAMAGLKRTGLESLAGRIFEPEEMIPAAGQGVLAVQGRSGESHTWIAQIDDETSRITSICERQFVAALDGGCSAPTAAYAKLAGNELKLTGLYYHEADDRYQIQTKVGTVDKARALGETLAREMERQL